MFLRRRNLRRPLERGEQKWGFQSCLRMRANSQTSAQPTGCPIAGKHVPPSIHFLPREP